MSGARARRERGFTLTELMVVIGILAITAAIAVPPLVRDDAKGQFTKGVRVLVQDLWAARHQSTSSREAHAIIVDNLTTYRMVRVAADGTLVDLKTVTVPPQVQLTAVVAGGPASTDPSSGAGLPAEIRFDPVGPVLAAIAPGALSTGATSVTVFVETEDHKHRSRIVIYGVTGYTKVLDQGW